MKLAERTWMAVHPAVRCICSRTLSGSDFEMTRNRIRLLCSRCHRELVIITIRVITENGELEG